MNLSERINRVEAQRRLPADVEPVNRLPERRKVARWIEWTRDNEQGKDLTGRAA